MPAAKPDDPTSGNREGGSGDPDLVNLALDPERAPEVTSRRRFLVPVVLLVLVAAIAVLVVGRSGDSGAPRLTVTAAAATPGALGEMASVYLVVDNDGAADSVVSPTSEDAAVVTLHDTEEADGGEYMVDVDRLTVPKRGTLTLSPGGRHLMLHHLYAPLEPGDVIRLTIVFERSGPMEVEVPVLSLVALAPFGSDG